jgi:hypothetical protein
MFPKNIFIASVISHFSGAIFIFVHWKSLLPEIYVTKEKYVLKLWLKEIVLSYEGCSIYSEYSREEMTSGDHKPGRGWVGRLTTSHCTGPVKVKLSLCIS